MGLKKTINWMKKHMLLLIVADMLVALGFSYFWQTPILFLKKYALIASFLMVYPIMINTNFSEIFNLRGRYKLIISAIIFLFIIEPLLLYLILKLITTDPLIAAGLMFIAIMPTSGMAVVWTKISKGAASLTIVILGLSLILSMLTIPLEAHFIIGQYVHIPLWILIKSLLVVLLLPLILGWLTRLTIIKNKGEERFIELKSYISSISSLGLLSIIFIAFGLKGKVIVSKPILMIHIAIPMIIFYAIGFFILTLLGKLFKISKSDIVGFNYSAMTKNRSMATAIAILILDPLSVTAIALAGVIAQIPMMLVYSKFIQKSKFKKL